MFSSTPIVTHREPVQNIESTSIRVGVLLLLCESITYNDNQQATFSDLCIYTYFRTGGFSIELLCFSL